MATTAVPLTLEALLGRAPSVSQVRVHGIELRKTDPTWRFALAAHAASPGVLLELVADGITGWGSACEVRHLGHDLDDMIDQITAALPGLRGGDRAGLRALHGPARAAVHMAVADLVARAGDVPVHALLGAAVRDSVALTRILSLKSPAEMAAAALAHRDEGYRNVKVKLDNEGEGVVDVERVRAIRAAVGKDFGITIDANQSYGSDAALRLVDRIAEFDVQLFEQPVPADDLDALAYVTQRSAVPIEADEAADSLDRIRAIIDRGAAHGVSIKVAKLGGLDHALTAARECVAAGLHVRIGAHVGSRLLNAAALHVAAVLPTMREPAELAEFARLEDDPAVGLEIVDGTAHVPTGAGLGVSVPVPPRPTRLIATIEE